MLNGDLERSAKLDGLYAGIPGRQQFEIRNIAGRGPTRAETGESHPAQLLPAPCILPRPIVQPLERPSGVAEHAGNRRGPARRPLAGRNGDLDLVDLSKASRQAVNHCGGQCGHRARARDRYQSCRTGCGIVVRGEAYDEFPAIRQINVVRARADCRLGHTIVLALERPGAVNQDVGGKPLQ